MREFYKEYFKVSEKEKISDKVMMTRIGVSAVLIVLYVIAMSISAYAYFYHGVASQNNTIKSAEFRVNVTAVEENGTVTTDSQEQDSAPLAEYVSTDDQATPGLPYYKAALKAGKKYTITVTIKDGSTASTGFCVVKFYSGEIADSNLIGKAYHTQQLGVDRMKNLAETKSITFTILPQQDMTATFLAHWGTSSYYEAYKNVDYYIEDKESVTVPFANVSNQGGNQLDEESQVILENPTPDPSVEPVEPSVEPVEPSVEPVEPSVEPVEPSVEPVDPEPVVHKVARGETLSAISRQYDVSVERIVAYNGIEDPDMIITGTLITIPPADWQMPAEA